MIVCVVNLKLVFSSCTHTFMSFLLFLFSNCSFLLVIWFTSKFNYFTNVGAWEVLSSSFQLQCLYFYIIVNCMLVEYGYSRTRKILFELFKPNENLKRKHSNSVLHDKERRCNKMLILDTGFAFVEDVANLRQLINNT